MRRLFRFRDDAVAFLEREGYRYCNTLGWFGWWNLEKQTRAIVDFAGATSRRPWAVTTWRAQPRSLPPVGANFREQTLVK